jgi:hypothetical protein
VKPTPNPWRPGEPDEVLNYRTETGLARNLPAIPLVNKGWDSMPEGWQQFTLAKATAQGLGYAYKGLIIGVTDLYVGGILPILLLGLTLISWLNHRPIRARKRAGIQLPAGDSPADTSSFGTASEVETLEPIR